MLSRVWFFDKVFERTFGMTLMRVVVDILGSVLIILRVIFFNFYDYFYFISGKIKV